MAYDSRPETLEHIEKVDAYIHEAIENLVQRGLMHDSSKLVEPELSVFNEYTPRLKDLVFGSEEYEANKRAMSGALEHHFSVNSRHPEHFENGIQGMSLLDLLEMICDWKAASERNRPGSPPPVGRAEHTQYDSNFARSIEINQERFGYSDELKSILLNTARELGYL